MTVVVAALSDPLDNMFVWVAAGILVAGILYKLMEFMHAGRVFRQQLAIYQWELDELETSNGAEEEDGRRRGADLQPTDNLSSQQKKKQLPLLPIDKDDPELQSFLLVHRREIYGDGTHALCGCAWGADRNHPLDFDQDENEKEPAARRRTPSLDSTADDGDICSDLWRFLADSCCGVMFGCYCQCCGMCATSQEHRHLKRILPLPLANASSSSSSHVSAAAASAAADLWQRDYVTFQPWKDYFPTILRLRLSNETGLLKHLRATSILSHRLIVSAGGFVSLATAIVVILPVTFPRWQILVLYGTLLQPTVILYFVHWVWHRLDISMDAVIKFFASGFFICTSLSILYEMIASILASVAIFLVTLLGTLGLVLFGNENTVSLEVGDGYDDDVNASTDGLKPTVQLPMPFSIFIATLTALVNAFLVAALVEELGKYLCFYMVEHPDLERDNVVLLPLAYASKATNDQTGTGESTENAQSNESSRLKMADNDSTAATYDTDQLVPAPLASLVSVGAATTIAMITTALGFACAENLLYVFLYTPPGLNAELSTLMIRCLFPIHPLAAALQSIGVCRRDLERDASVGVGYIVLPAWLLHGSFDFALMAFSLVSQAITDHKGKEKDSSAIVGAESSLEKGAEDDTQVSPFVASFVFVIPVIGIMYYFQEAWAQRERLELLDRRNRIRQ